MKIRVTFSNQHFPQYMVALLCYVGQHLEVGLDSSTLLQQALLLSWNQPETAHFNLLGQATSSSCFAPGSCVLVILPCFEYCPALAFT